MAEYDFEAGFDLASVSTVTRVQLMQALNQLAYLTNRAGIVFSATTPDVTNNSHLKRYAWLDTSGGTHPVLKLYDQSEASGVNNPGNWAATPVSAGSITNTHINAAAAIAVTKLAFGTARYVLRTNAAGTANEFVSPADINQANEIAVNKLVAAGGDSYLKTVGGAVIWTAQATERSAIQNAIIGLNPAQIAAGGAGTILASSGGIAAFVSPSTAIGAGNLPLSLLEASGAVTGDVLRYTGVAWDNITPSLSLGALVGSGLSFGLLSAFASNSAATNRLTHSLGRIPNLLFGYIKNTSGGIATGSGHPANYIIPVEHVLYNGGNDPQNFNLQADSTYVAVSVRDYTAAPKVLPYAGGAAYTAITLTEWTLYVHAW